MYIEQNSAIIWEEITQIFAKHRYTIGKARKLLTNMALHVGEDQVFSGTESSDNE